MKLKKIFCVVCLLSLISFSAFSLEDDPLTVLLKKLDEYTKRFPTEKVHLQFDKPYYAIGDDIWFKAYVIDSRTSSPSTISNILYVELIGEDNSIKRQLRLPMQNGTSWGDFKLVDTLAEGNYRIRAYTQWMRNMGPQFFFDKTIKIGNSWANSVTIKTQFSFLKLIKGDITKAVISFTDSLGNPLIHKNVAYEIRLEEKNIIKGKEKTNETGGLTLDFPSVKNKNNLRWIDLVIDLNADQKIVRHIPIQSTPNEIDLQFFPEGGHIVDGITSRVAIKSINTSGLGQNVKGIIFDNEGIEITPFETTYLGMGSFTFLPIAGKTYTARFKVDNGPIRTARLPNVEKSGYAITAYDIDTGSIGVKISMSADLINKGNLSFISHHNGKAYTVATIPSSEQSSLVILKRRELPSGILQLTLFSPANLPVCERLVFIKNAIDTVKFQLQNLKSIYNKRQGVALSLSTDSNKVVWANFSVAVTNTSTITPDLENESNILTSLLLTSDLTGYIEKPNHYFLKDDAKTKNELDQLLLTQGWRKINWPEVANGNLTASSFEAEKGINLSGSIRSDKKPMSYNKITLYSKLSGLLDTLSNGNGNFFFKDLSFPEQTKVVIKAKIKKEKDVLITIDTIPQQVVNPINNYGDFEMSLNKNPKPQTVVNKSQNQVAKPSMFNGDIQLKEVKIVGKQVNAVQNSSNLNGPGNADYVLDASNLTSANALDIFLQGRVPGITVRGGYAFSLHKPGNMNSRLAQDTMTVVLDGLQMERDYSLREVNTEDIESVEVLVSASKLAIYGGRAANGLIIITTKKGKPSRLEKQNSPGVITYIPKGYYVQREFYSPKYDVESNNNMDLRNTIYWNPNLTTDEKGISNFSYFNSDETGIYRIVLEGFDTYGNLARKAYTYQVK